MNATQHNKGVKTMTLAKSENNNKAVMINRANNEICVVFGRWYNDEFNPEIYRTERFYKTEKRAQKAVNNWIMLGK